ncbi:MAG: hypothetical protein ACPG4T_09920, partial [Nannocystaceae bacterium]
MPATRTVLRSPQLAQRVSAEVDMSLNVHTLAQLLHTRAKQSPDACAIRVKQGTAWADRTWKQLAARADQIAAGILSAVELADNDVVG